MSDEIQPYVIRPLTPRDVPAVVSVDRMVFRDPWPESTYVQEIYFNPNAHYFVLESQIISTTRRWFSRRAIHEEQILGFVGMRVENERGHISTLALRPEWRGRGLGELLLLSALEQAVHDGAESVTLEVRISNHVAQNLYNKYGFVRISRLHSYYADGEDAYLMRSGPVDMAYRKNLDDSHTALMARLRQQTIEFVSKPGS
ncbi:MAG: ribosomal protein S18-alanine N-acetyltransferase [Anaerolineae bacterium]|nr:ribosomal protein S18-alanine N-acetyltransferase [Anaerolineae bacterium]